MKFVCSDESLNSYGFWILTSGINIEKFQKNPIMLWNHTRQYSDRKDAILPIGYWKDVRIEKGQLIAEAVFDTEDEFAKQVASKVEKGILRSCSIGIRILSTSTEPDMLKPGQTRETVTSCELREISICDIPSNGNAVAVAFYDADGHLVDDLSDSVELTLPRLLTNTNTKMKEILKELGLNDSAEEAQAVAEVRKLRDRIQELEKEKKEAEEAVLKDMVDEAVRQRKITEAKRNAFMEIGRKSGAAALKEILSDIAAPMKPSEIINRTNDVGKEKTFKDLTDEEREDMRKNDRDRYCRLYEAEYGFKPEID